jgi:ABC-type branched-subunit amino acid transport system substrate-binding protein
VSLLQQQISSGHTPNLLIPGTSSNDVDALLPVAAKAGILVVTNQLSPELNDVAKFPYAFSDSDSPAQFETAMVQTLKAKGYKSFGFLSQAGADGQADAAAFIQAAHSLGLTAKAAFIPATAVDATSELQQLAAASPQALVFDAYGPAVAYLLKARQTLGIKIPTFGDNALAANDLVAAAGAAAAKGIDVQAIDWQIIGSPLEKGAPFKELFSRLMAKKEITVNIEPFVFPYDCIVLTAAASTVAKSTATPAISAAIETITPSEAPLFIGPLGYSSTSHFPDWKASDYELVPGAANINGRLPAPPS